jgi:hypothetical protein
MKAHNRVSSSPDQEPQNDEADYTLTPYMELFSSSYLRLGSSSYFIRNIFRYI